MSADVPAVLVPQAPRVPQVLDAWRMVAARRGFQGRIALSSLTRLRDVLCDVADAPEVVFTIEFDRDALQVPYVELRVDAQLPLQCQRSLQRFLHPVQVVQRLGLIRDEADEAGLPPDYEPWLLAADGMLRPADLVEDELILAVPVVPMQPGAGTEPGVLPPGAAQHDWPGTAVDAAAAKPFAALAALSRTTLKHAPLKNTVLKNN